MFSVLKKFYENVYLLAFEIHDTVVMFCYERIFGKPCFLVDPYYQVLTYLMIAQLTIGNPAQFT